MLAENPAGRLSNGELGYVNLNPPRNWADARPAFVVKSANPVYDRLMVEPNDPDTRHGAHCRAEEQEAPADGFLVRLNTALGRRTRILFESVWSPTKKLFASQLFWTAISAVATAFAAKFAADAAKTSEASTKIARTIYSEQYVNKEEGWVSNLGFGGNPSKTDPSLQELTLELAISNSGNRGFLVREVSVELAYFDNPGIGFEKVHIPFQSQTPPQLVEPGKLIQITWRHTVDLSYLHQKYFVPIASDDGVKDPQLGKSELMLNASAVVIFQEGKVGTAQFGCSRYPFQGERYSPTSPSIAMNLDPSPRNISLHDSVAEIQKKRPASTCFDKDARKLIVSNQ